MFLENFNAIYEKKNRRKELFSTNLTFHKNGTIYFYEYTKQGKYIFTRVPQLDPFYRLYFNSSHIFLERKSFLILF